MLADRENVEPLLDFFAGALNPRASAGVLIVSSDTLRWWERTKVPLTRVAETKSRWASDAKLLLACGKWLVEKDTENAIHLAELIIQDYPQAESILEFEPSQPICSVRLDPRVVAYFRTLYKSGESSIYLKQPSKATISQEPFLLHILNYPVRTADIARLFAYSISEGQRKSDARHRFLEEILENNPQIENEKIQADMLAGITAEWPSSEVFIRPNGVAALFLLDFYKSQGNGQKLMSYGVKVLNLVSPDGWYWPVNRKLGDYLLDSKLDDARPEAERQYRLALKGCLKRIACEARKAQSLKRTGPRKILEKRLLELKERVKKAGGDIEVNSKELGFILEQKEESKSTSVNIQDKAIKTLKEIHSGKDKYADPKERKMAAASLVNIFQQEAKATDANKADIRKLRKSMAIGLAHLAVSDKDTDVCKAMLTAVNEIIQPQGEYETDSINDADRKKVDDLLAQIIGEKVKKPVPYPETNLADMNSPALLYAAERVRKDGLSLEAKRRIVRALTNSENSLLYTFFGDLVRDSTDAKLKKHAVRGLERIIENANIDDNGMILMSD
ncbi:hypothetical protein ACFLS1_02835 [Verrucomicrobiota bacterium]